MEECISRTEPLITIFPGDIFIQGDIPVPPTFHAFESYGCWRRLLFPPLRRAERMALAAGWHFVFVMTPVQGRGLGRSRVTATDHALANITQRVSTRGCNALEISDVQIQKTFGLYHLNVAGYCRHLAQSPFLRPLDPHQYAEDIQEFEQIFWRASRVPREIKGI